jgi:glycosyltransferase involved in cell wall biosynthesis
MRIGLDVRYLSHGLVGGIHTYLTNFIPALVAQAIDHEIYLYADTKRSFELSNLPDNVTVRLLPYSSPLSSIYLDFFIWKWMVEDKINLAHFPANYGFTPGSIPAVLTLHDEINLMPLGKIIRGHPKKLQTIGLMTYLHLCSRLSIRRAAIILTVSEYARKQILKYSGLPPGRVVSIYHSPSPDLQRITDPEILAQVRKRYHLDKPFLLADGLKNPAVLVRAWHRLPLEIQARYQIVFFSRRPDPPPIIHHAVDQGAAVLLINPPRGDLIALFSQAELFVFPSWIEGFGIPLLEAMTCGAPIIASNRGSIPEILADAGLIIDAEDDPKLAECISSLLNNPEEAELFRTRGYHRAKDFSWNQTANRVIDLYQSVL